MDLDLRQKVLESSDDWTNDVNETSLDYDFMTRHSTLSIAFLTFTCVSVVLGNIGNVMVIGAVVSYRPLLRNKGSMFVINLAIADLCITGIISPMNMVGVTHGPSYFVNRAFLCHALGSICTVSCIVSMLSIAAVAVNRALQICCHFSYEAIFTLKKTLMYCTGLWLLAIVIDLPIWFSVGHTFALKEMGCTFDRTANYPYSVFMALFSTVTPLVIVCSSHLMVYRYVHKANEKYKAYLGKVDASRRQDERQFAFTLLVSFMVFLLCWSVYISAILFDSDDEWPKQVYVVGTMIGHANSTINPIIYATLNRNFRHGYSIFLKRLTCQEVPREPMLRERRFSNFAKSATSTRKKSISDLRSTASTLASDSDSSSKNSFKKNKITETTRDTELSESIREYICASQKSINDLENSIKEGETLEQEIEQNTDSDSIIEKVVFENDDVENNGNIDKEIILKIDIEKDKNSNFMQEHTDDSVMEEYINASNNNTQEDIPEVVNIHI